MPVNGNSIPGPDGSIGRRYTGPNAVVAGLDTERSRAAFKQRVKAKESKALELREYTYRYIYRWTLEEKLAIINSYGEIDLVQDRSDHNEVNNQLVETLLINLTEAELNQIVSNVNAQTAELTQKMKTFSKNADARSKVQRSQDFYRTSRPQGANSSGNAPKANPANASQIGKDMQKEDPTG